MKQVCLFCSTRMSTDILVNRMQDVANSRDLPIEVEALPDGKIGQIIDERHPDMILLGPQVKYRYDGIVERYGDKGIPIQVINQADYGMMNGGKVLKSVIRLMKAAR